jgi:hypothetical protein
MKILIIDSHKGTEHGIPQNMHWQNAKILSEYLGADLIWSYPNVNENIKSGYDIIIFVHASHYAYTDYKWLQESPNARLYYITNEYNLGEPRTLWMAAKEGRKYKVIANHPHEASKVVMKYVDDWFILNLNCLIFNPRFNPNTIDRRGCIYYGSFRKDRSKYFDKYLNEDVFLSTHSKNIDKFKLSGATSEICKRIDWNKDGLFPYKQSLYIEDEKTHIHYNYLANRFYEALNYGCVPIFSRECEKTVELSGYEISNDYFIDSSAELKNKTDLPFNNEWCVKAEFDRMVALTQISKLLL